MAVVSVVLPVFNGQRYVVRAVKSILGQTLNDLEIIIVDDGSRDHSLSLMRKMALNDPRVRIIMHRNGGIERALNEGIADSKAEFIARMDADDISLPDRLALQLKFMQSHDSVVVLGGAYQLIDDADRYLTTLIPPRDNATLQDLALSGRNPFCHPLVMMRRQAVEKVGGYTTDFPAAEDLDLWLRMGEIGEMACIPDVLLEYRLHAESISESKQETQIINMRSACERARKRRGVTREFMGNEPWRPTNTRNSRHSFALRYGWWAFKSGEKCTAMTYGLKAIRLAPWNQAGWRLLVCAAIK